jgi:phage baseplate assembly protein V
VSDSWNGDDFANRTYHRTRNTVSRATLKLGDDTTPLQQHQTEGYVGEIRNDVQRHGEFGFASMPLPSAEATILYHGGHRGFGTILGIEDSRYRLKGLKAGETGGYMVDGADAKGEGGTLRKLWHGTIGWAHSIFGKTINIGDGDTLTINVTGGTINLNCAHGDIVVNGISLVHHTHTGVTTGSGNTGPPQ